MPTRDNTPLLEKGVWDEVRAAVDATENPQSLSLAGRYLPVKLVSVYDGDTVTLAVPLVDAGVPLRVYKWSCRLDGVDTPELRTKNAAEKVAGYAARDALRELLDGSELTAECGKFDKYGRLLVRLFADGVDVTRWLIEQGHALAYDGGTKQVRVYE